MTDLARYFSPLIGWTAFWWLIFNGALYQFASNAYGSWLRGLFDQLRDQWGKWGVLLEWLG